MKVKWKILRRFYKTKIKILGTKKKYVFFFKVEFIFPGNRMQNLQATTKAQQYMQ